MSERKTPLQLQLELNDLMSQRVDIMEKWCKELTSVVRELSARVAELEKGNN